MQTKEQKPLEKKNESVLRMSSAVEDAPYVLESARVVNATLAASCSRDADPFMLRRPAGTGKSK